MRDYWLNRFFFDMQRAEVRQRFDAAPDQLMADYRLSSDARRAVLSRDVAFLAARTNPYLLRYFFGYMGMSDQEFIRQLRALPVSAATAHG